MIKFENYDITQKNQYTELNADTTVLMDNESEIYRSGTPLIWDTTFLERVPIDNFTVYHVCIKLVPHGKHSRITDYQKIWKLNNISPGLYDNSYLCQEGKAYFGITRSEGIPGFYSDESSFVILSPKDMIFPCEMIFRLFSNSNYASANDVNLPFLKELYDLIPGSYIMLYNVCYNAKLKLYSPLAENPFVGADIFLWEGHITSPVYRKR